jgi:DNA-binding transcriptional LysR family regulator
MTPFELRQLRYFVAVAEELHFGRAAKRLGIAQPPLSQQIQRFERSISVQLFESTRRSVTLTPAGEALLPEAIDLLSRADRALEIVQDIAFGRAGRLTIGFVGSASMLVLPELLKAFRNRYPGFELELIELTTNDQYAALEEGRIQIGCVRTPLANAPFSSALISRERLVLALPDNLFDEVPDPVPLEAMAEAPFIMPPRRLGHSFHDIARAACSRAGFTPRVVQEAIQMQTILGLVAAGIGVALVPESMGRIPRDGVICRRLLDADAYSDLVLVWNEREERQTVKNFVDLAESLMLSR